MRISLDDKIYIASLRASLVSLNARLNAAKGYVLNNNLQLECDLLRKQIAAINEEISKVSYRN